MHQPKMIWFATVQNYCQ